MAFRVGDIVKVRESSLRADPTWKHKKRPLRMRITAIKRDSDYGQPCFNAVPIGGESCQEYGWNDMPCFIARAFVLDEFLTAASRALIEDEKGDK